MMEHSMQWVERAAGVSCPAAKSALTAVVIALPSLLQMADYLQTLDTIGKFALPGFPGSWVHSEADGARSLPLHVFQRL